MGHPIPRNDLLTAPAPEQTGDRVKKLFISEETAGQRAQRAESEFGLLRTDYLNRIAGMVKAIAAVERSHDKATEAVGYLENLNGMSAAELIEEYRRTSARFRSAFPTTFGLGPLHSYKSKGVKNPGDYK